MADEAQQAPEVVAEKAKKAQTPKAAPKDDPRGTKIVRGGVTYYIKE